MIDYPFNFLKFNFGIIFFFLVFSLKEERESLNYGNQEHSFETRLGPEGQPGTRPTRGWNRAGLKKK
jgi:hypothetical protein